MPKRILSLLMVAALVAGPLVQRAEAGRDKFPPVIRDAEIEKTLREYTTPIFQVAGLDPTAVHIFLLQSDQINAFVAGGMNVFIYTGLLVRTQRPGQLIGVVAHETGHIAGGHLVRLQQAMNDAPLEMIISAVLSGGILLRYTRTMEASADAAALTFLDRLHQSARGMMEFLQILQHQEFVLVGQLNPYLINHPLTSDRIDNVRQHVEQSPYGNVPDPPAWVDQHNRMIAKLVGFLWPFQQVLIKYPESDKSLYGRYARAIAYFRAGDLVHSLALIDQLIAENPMDPYFPEQKGQILFENGRGAEALTAYQRALDLAPDEPLIRMELANVQIEQESPGLLKPAIQELKVVVRQEPHNSDAWRLLGIAFGRDGQIGKASWALAEGAALRGDDKQARHLADEAMKQLPMGSPEWLRSQDIFSAPKPTKDESSGGISG